jgi:hypothetical protein
MIVGLNDAGHQGLAKGERKIILTKEKSKLIIKFWSEE